MTQTDLTPEQIVMLCVCDYASQVRGKGFPLTELPIRQRQGMGLAPTNLMINALDRLAGSARLREWLGSEFIDSYAMTKRGELGLLAELDDAERVARY